MTSIEASNSDYIENRTFDEIAIGDSATLGAHPFYLELIDFVQKEEFYKSAFEVGGIGNR